MSDPDIDHYIRSVQDTLRVARLNYEIWWVYKAKDTRPKYIDSMNRYLGFFSTSIHAHFVANVVALYRVLEKRHDSINLNRLFCALSPATRGKLPTDFGRRMERARQIWKKISIIRNNCFGHLNGEQGISDMFRQAALTPNEICEFMNLSERLINDISLAWNGSTHAFNLESRQDTIRLLDDLNTLGTR